MDLRSDTDLRMAWAEVARYLSRFAWSRRLCIVGASTLYIYVMHKVAIFDMQHGFDGFGIVFPGRVYLELVLAVGLCTLIGRWAARRPLLAWLFRAPWLGGPAAADGRPGSFAGTGQAAHA